MPPTKKGLQNSNLFLVPRILESSVICITLWNDKSIVGFAAFNKDSNYEESVAELDPILYSAESTLFLALLLLSEENPGDPCTASPNQKLHIIFKTIFKWVVEF